MHVNLRDGYLCPACIPSDPRDALQVVARFMGSFFRHVGSCTCMRLLVLGGKLPGGGDSHSLSARCWEIGFGFEEPVGAAHLKEGITF